MSGQWPPEWEDPEEESPEVADQLDATELSSVGEARLSEVAAYLGSVPAPALPEAVEARISAALAAEAASRAEGAGSRTLGPAPARARVRRHRGSDVRPGGGRRWGLRQVTALGSLVACLLLAGLVYGLTRGGPSPESSAASAPMAQPPGSGASAAAGAAAPAPVPSAPGSRYPQASPGPEAALVVIGSGTRYQKATLAMQVRATLAAEETRHSPAPAASPELRGCVLHLTGGTPPQLVDRATYQGEPAYIVAGSSHVWVVEPGCTAAKPGLIASVPLAGLPGNLRALVSVDEEAMPS